MNDIDDMNDPVVGIKDLIEVMTAGQVRPLLDINNVEAALSMIKQSEDRIRQYEDFKRKKIEAINQEITKLCEREEFLKSVICETLKSNNEKTIRFPGTGKATIRRKRGKWVIKDEDKLTSVLKKEGELANVTETTTILKKGELNKLLDVWEKISKLPSCVDREPDGDSVSVSFDEEIITPNVTIPVKKASIKDLDFTGGK